MYKKILIDSLYINSGGGKSILLELINDLRQKNKLADFYFLFDRRLSVTKNDLKDLDYEFLQPSLKNRKLFYKLNKDRYRCTICLANIPPPITIDKPVYIYFHNVLLLEPFNKLQGLKTQLSNFIKKNYIRSNNKKTYKWIVQTNLMKTKLKLSFNIEDDKILKLPIFNTIKSFDNVKKNNSFLYVSNYSSHKNFKRLINSFIHYANENTNQTEINFTLEDNIFKKLIKNRYIPESIKFINHGKITYQKINNLYKKTQFMIFPSINESFGLPLIEAINHECMVIAPNLPYVNEIIIPSINFDPFSTQSISSSIREAVKNSNLKASKIIIENKIDTFVKYVYENI